MAGFPTADTFSSLTDEVITSLQGFTLLSDQPYTLTADIAAGSLALTLDTASIARGVVEIDQELIYVSSASSGVAQIPAWGRGWKGTAAAAHTAGTAVYVAPVYPRSVVAREVNNTIRSVFPDLFAVKSLDLSVNPLSWQYQMPADAERILSVEWRWDTISGWNPIVDWEMVTNAATADFTTGKFLSIQMILPAAAKIHVTYAAVPTLLVNPADTFDMTGLPTSSRDVIVLGAASRLLPWIDTGRTPAETVSADMTDQQRPIGAGVQLAKEIRQRYDDRLSKERAALFARYPIRAHRIRG